MAARRRRARPASVDDRLGRAEPPAIRPSDVALNPVRLLVFCTVVERGSFRRAADELCLAQPTVSGHIHVLEELFGAPLFDRRRRGAQLTEAGRAVYDFAVSVRRELTALRAHLSDLADGQAGSVALAAAPVPATYILPELLARFHQQRPGARVQLRLLNPDAIGEEVQRGHVDFGIISEATPAEALECEPLWVEPIVLVARADHPLTQRQLVTPADLAAEPFIIGSVRNLGDRALDRALAAAGLPPRRVVLEVGNHEGIKQAVLHGVGLAVLFRRVVTAELAAGHLVALPFASLPMAEQFLMVYRRTHRFTPLAASLMAFIRSEARGVAARGGEAFAPLAAGPRYSSTATAQPVSQDWTGS
ncbi:MAG: LysR family transcriptional regulator [Chloroflexi bacterium]|nr:LysR family transcriptional regulator [Chloroflexota bacterium]